MKKFFKRLLQYLLRRWAIRVLRRFRPEIIAITGSLGKTSTKEAIYQVLKGRMDVQRNTGSYNTEIGVPLSILGLKTSKSFFAWIFILVRAFVRSFSIRSYPDKLIVEMGADHLGDIKSLTSFIKPTISVVTHVAPTHLQFLKSIDNVAKEKGALVEALDQTGWAVLNFDDERVRAMGDRTSGQIIYYGTDSGADVRATNITTDLGKVYFDLCYKKEKVLVEIQALGRHQIYPALAAASCGIVYGIKLPEIAKSLGDYKLPKGRANLINGPKNSIIIDDTYNASPESMKAAIDILNDISGDLKKGRRIAVVGDMKELGGSSKKYHQEIGEYLKKRADVVFAIGIESKAIFNTVRTKFSKRSWWFRSADEAKEYIGATVKENDIILVKGSRGMEMERIVQALKKLK